MPLTKIQKFCTRKFPCFGAHSAAFIKISTRFFLKAVSVSNKEWLKGGGTDFDLPMDTILISTN